MVEPSPELHDAGDEEVTISLDRPVAKEILRISVPSTALALRPRDPFDLDALPRPFDPRLVILDDPNGARAASFRVLRDALVTRGLPRVVAVSSATPGEGKTTCVANLALAFAERPWTKVLVFDANVFAPELGSMFAIGCMRRVVMHETATDLAPYQVVEVMPSLHLCAIPWRPDEPAPAIDQRRFDMMVERFVEMGYDHVLLDTPAIRGTPATVPIIGLAEGTLLVAKSGSTKGRDLRRAADQIPPEKGLGVALMDAPTAD